MSLSGKTALITGAGSGIGADCARKLADSGARALVLDVRAEAAEKVAAEVGGEAVVVGLAELAMVDAVMAKVDADVVVHNVGLQYLARLEDFPPEEFDRMLAVMLQAPFRITRALLPGIYARGWGGSSTSPRSAGPSATRGKAPTVAAKHGTERLSKTIAREGATHGVTSNCIAPAWVDTR